MSKEARRTLVVDLDLLESSRDLFREMAKAEDSEIFREQADLLERVISHGTTVELEAAKVAGFAWILKRAEEIRQEDEQAKMPWERPERVYSEAQAADEDALRYDPSCAYCRANGPGLSPAGGAA